MWGRSDSQAFAPGAPSRTTERGQQVALRQREALRRIGAADSGDQILFGDLHVHTTISFDAFMLNLPLMGGEGAHTPADACDFARHCAALDFYSLNDHASNIDPDDWRRSIESIRQCNALAGSPEAPDMVAFLGWEWTQAGLSPEDHYGHKNVVLARYDEGHVPSRPIAATAGGLAARPPSIWARGALAIQAGGRMHDLARRWTSLGGMEICEAGDVRTLPDDCREVATTPATLFRKLDEWGHDSIVIPHGTTWGIYTPPGSNWKHQLTSDNHDPERQTLIEVYSGHGQSEVYRDWRSLEISEGGDLTCPEERPDYLPLCQQAGRIVRERCLALGESRSECNFRAAEARRYALEAGISPQVTVPGAGGEDWLDAGQCRDCQQPAFKYRPGGSAQYIAALGSFPPGSNTAEKKDGVESAEKPRRFRMGFIAASDIHTARAGSGYKEFRFMTDAGQRKVPPQEGVVGSFLRGAQEEPSPRARSITDAREKLSGFQFFETERTQSFLYTGGLTAVHASGRDRASIWDALKSKRVYGTSGPRILLHFDLVDGQSRHPMGSELAMSSPPRFEIRAVGSFEELPGCPGDSAGALGPMQLQRLCRGECHNPSDTRRPISRIEIVRIRPQVHPEESLDALIQDPWLSVNCPEDPNGCTASFEDPEFETAHRDTVYYVRAFESPKPTVNGSMLACRAEGKTLCAETNPCERGEECLAPDEPRAWSSPIYVDFVPIDQELADKRG
ncbi:MAG TPA: DUF3604 domain-containing protein [Myxococcales bacterium]|nr:DUF3604 domain-containing protein [Myxococcales bacterium]